MKSARLSALFAITFIAVLGTSNLQAEDSGVQQTARPSLAQAMNTDPSILARDAAAMKRRIAEKGGFFPSLGNWFDPSAIGWGLDIQAIGDVIFAVWFTYLADGSPTWYIIVGELEVKGNAMTLTGEVDSFKWDPFGLPPNQASSTTVGTMTIEWSDEVHAEASWTLNGNDNAASIAYAPFAPGIAFSNLTGHYFPFFAPGWGFTLLTQGDVTVLTMYWYKNGQPVWAQAVSGTPGFNMVMTLLYFTGLGLCPECLTKQGEKGFVTETLTDVNIFYAPGTPPDVLITWPDAFGKGPGPLGPDPFGDIPLDFGAITASAITSAYGDNFDPTYATFGAMILDLGLDSNCLPFSYDNGSFSATLTGTFSTAYFLLAPTPDGGLPVYTDAKCTQPFNFVSPIDSAPVQSVLMGAGTDDMGDKGSFIFTEAVQVSWSGYWEDVFSKDKQSVCDLSEGLSLSGLRGRRPDKLAINLFGPTRGEKIICNDSFRDYFVIELAPRPPGPDIAAGLNDEVFISGHYGTAGKARGLRLSPSLFEKPGEH